MADRRYFKIIDLLEQANSRIWNDFVPFFEKIDGMITVVGFLVAFLIIKVANASANSISNVSNLCLSKRLLSPGFTKGAVR